MITRRTRQAPGRADPVPASPVQPPVLVGRRRIAELTGSWRTALRIARRESRRARRRTALVLAMIALPVAALAFLAANYDMAELTAQERVDRRLGVADAELQWVANGPVGQDEWGEGWNTQDGKPPPRVTAAQMTALLGPGSRVTEVRPHAPLTLRGPDRDENVSGRVLDLGDPLARGLVRFLAGRAPQQPGEVAVSPAALRRLDLRLGDAVTVADGSRAYTVVGVVEFPTTSVRSWRCTREPYRRPVRGRTASGWRTYPGPSTPRWCPGSTTGEWWSPHVTRTVRATERTGPGSGSSGRATPTT